MATRRARDQEWLYDRLIAAGGVDSIWPMLEETLCAIGVDASGDVRTMRSSIKKYVHITRELRRCGEKREAMAREAEADGHAITARHNYFAAAAYYTMAQGPLHEDSTLNSWLSEHKNAAYEKYIGLADHRIEKVEIPFGRQSLPGYLHLPPNASGKLPCVVFLGGLDMFKELLVSSPTDKFLERGIAVLAFDGPGQNEARIARQIYCTPDNFPPAGKAAMDFLLCRSEIDGDRIGICGLSMGSFWVPQIVAHDPRYKAGAGFYVCHENGMDSILNIAIPMLRDRYMWMSGIEDDQEFDAFAEKLTLAGVGAQIKCPFLIVAGEDDEMSPIEHSHKFYDEIAGPKNLLIYRGERHGITDNRDVRAQIADWMKDRLDGKPFQSRIIYKDCRTGREVSGSAS